MHRDVNNVRSAQRRSTVMWSVEGRSSFLTLFQTSWISNPDASDWSGWSFDQRCSINLIMRWVKKLKLKFLTLSLHYQYYASWCQQCSVSSASIDRYVIHWREKLFFGALPNILNLKPWCIWLIRWRFNQRCSINLIMRRVTKLNRSFKLCLFNINIMHCDVNNVRSARRRLIVMWSIEVRSSSLTLFKHLGSQTLMHLVDQGEALIRCVVLTWLWEEWQS